MNKYEINGIYQGKKAKINVIADSLLMAKLLIEGHYKNDFIINHNDCNLLLGDLDMMKE